MKMSLLFYKKKKMSSSATRNIMLTVGLSTVRETSLLNSLKKTNWASEGGLFLFSYNTSCWSWRVRGLIGAGAFRRDPLQITKETINIILFIVTDALNIHMDFVCISTSFSRHTHTHSVWYIMSPVGSWNGSTRDEQSIHWSFFSWSEKCLKDFNHEWRTS